MSDREEETIGGFRGKWAFLSNMHETPCEHEGKIFRSSEHLYQWLKIPETGNGRWWRDRIFEAEHGKIAKKLAANPKCPCAAKKIGEEWEKFRLEIMEIALRAKFKNAEMRQLLLDTEDVTLVEYNAWNDVFWGHSNGNGRNLLGQMLMRLREEFRLENQLESQALPAESADGKRAEPPGPRP